MLIDAVAMIAATLRGGDGDRGEGPTLVRKRRLVADGFVGPALPREHRVLGFDGLIRAGQRRDPEKLAE